MMMMEEDLRQLRTEKQNSASMNLDRMSAIEIARLMNREDAKVASAIKKVLPRVARAIEVTAAQLSRGGRLIYVGSGTSGRIGALDASECPPTFSIEPRMVQHVIAGGVNALVNASESREDSPEFGRRDIARRKPGKKDVVVGIAASGRTPYTIGALKYAREKGAETIAIVCNNGSPLAKTAKLAIEVVVGAEVLTGSTRLKAGTAQKLVCNMISTGAMVRMGYAFGNLMVNVHVKNRKLIERGVSILQISAGIDRETAVHALKTAGMRVPVALVMLKTGATRSEAQHALKKAKGHLRKAINAIGER
jgi:N-acetylmuramic acid 6-phosphate etherase